MGFSARASARLILPAVCGLASWWLAAGCSSAPQKGPDSATAEQWAPPPPCSKDQVREYLCDDLLPMASERPAPEPYRTCPSQVGVAGNTFPATSSWARFDIPRTQWTRQRVPPGHACCYSWCSTLAVADVDAVDPNTCQQPNAMREQLCISVAEAGVSSSAAAPNEGCTAAVTPPAGVAFDAPKAAALDLASTAEKRAQGLAECCYAWCSKAPLGTGLGAK